MGGLNWVCGRLSCVSGWFELGLLVCFLVADNSSSMHSALQRLLCLHYLPASSQSRTHQTCYLIDQSCYLTQSHYTDTWPTSLSTDPVTPGSDREQDHASILVTVLT